MRDGHICLIFKGWAGWAPRHFPLMASDSEDPDILQCRESMSTMNTDGRSLSVTFDDRDEMTGSDPSDDDDDGGCESRVSMGNAAQHFPHVGALQFLDIILMFRFSTFHEND